MLVGNIITQGIYLSFLCEVCFAVWVVGSILLYGDLMVVFCIGLILFMAYLIEQRLEVADKTCDRWR